MSDNSVLAMRGVSQPSKALNTTFWIVQVLTAAVFLMSGGMKLVGSEMQVAVFEKVGLGQWFRYFTGGTEVLGAILLLVPRTAVIGAAMLAVTMIGAIATHLFIIGGSAAIPAVLLLMSLSVAWYRRRV